MPATRKISQAVQDQDLAQMQNLFNNSAIKTETVVTPEFETSENVETKHSAEKEEIHNVEDSNIITEEKKEVSDTTVGIRMTTAKKREMKAYFIQHGTTMSQGVIDAFTLLRKLENDGVVEYKDGLLEIV